MTGRAWFEVERRYLDTSNAVDREIVRSYRGRADRDVFRCEVNGGPLYVQIRNNTPTLCHYPQTAHGRCQYAFGMSDEHRRQQEYWAAAAERAGFSSELEVSTPRGTRIDVVIRGPQLVGIEVQRSHLTVAAAKARTTKSFRAGYKTLWTSASDARPKWADIVPSLRVTSSFAERMLRPGTATAVGPRTVSVELCEPGNRGPGCRRPCGRRHRPAFNLIRGLTIDDVAERFPAGSLVPLARYGHGNVYLVPPKSLELYCELTGQDAAWTPGGDPFRFERGTARGQSAVGQRCASHGTTPFMAAEPVPRPFRAECSVCGVGLHRLLVAAGESVHPTCDPSGEPGARTWARYDDSSDMSTPGGAL